MEGSRSLNLTAKEIAAAFAGITMFYAIGFAERRLIFWSRAEVE